MQESICTTVLRKVLSFLHHIKHTQNFLMIIPFIYEIVQGMSLPLKYYKEKDSLKLTDRFFSFSQVLFKSNQRQEGAPPHQPPTLLCSNLVLLARIPNPLNMVQFKATFPLISLD